MAAKQIIKDILDTKLIAILRGIGHTHIDGLCDALGSAGIKALEFTIDHKSENGLAETCEKIEYAAKQFPMLHIGAGTVLTPAGAEAAINAGASFIVSPSVSADTIKYTVSRGAVSIPGAMTPTECVNAYNAGADFVKLFPAGELGLAYFKAIKAPLAHIPMIAMGGITTENITAFAKLGAVGFGLSSGLINKEALANKDYKRIADIAKEYMRLISASLQCLQAPSI